MYPQLLTVLHFHIDLGNSSQLSSKESPSQLLPDSLLYGRCKLGILKLALYASY